ncbi:MAG: DUF928 domain-containing protein [Cyanobacteria bacterium SBC]|nr:DUF928 domain-containing protein [Cyanobacteria bacterium SBC]
MYFNNFFFKTLLYAIFASVLLFVTGIDRSIRASASSNNRELRENGELLSVEFQPPGDPVPPSSVGGGVRGSIQFAPPGEAAPGSSVGGGVRGNVEFAPPGDVAPGSSVGGGVRGNVEFAPPGEAAPGSSVGGGVRGDVEFAPPGDVAPGSSVGGGVRGDDQLTLTALLPPSQHGRTLSPRPTFFVYVPPTASMQAFFSVQDDLGNSHYQTLLELTGGGRTMAITLPDDVPELELDRNYVWFFAPIEPGGILRPGNYGVVGWVKRVEAPATLDRSFANPIEQATDYAASGIWYDTLDVLISARRSQPNNDTLHAEWQELLQQVGLEAIASEPISQP